MFPLLNQILICFQQLIAWYEIMGGLYHIDTFNGYQFRYEIENSSDEWKLTLFSDFHVSDYADFL